MANHKSAIKRIRANEVKRVRNRYYAKTARNAVRLFLKTTSLNDLNPLLSKVFGMLDKLAKNNIIHANKAARVKSKLHKHYNSLA